MRVVGIEGNVDSARVLVFEENLVPGLASVGGAKDSAFRVRAKWMAERGHIHDIRVLRIDDYFTDCPRIAKTNIFPRLPAVDRLVHSVAMRNVAANAGLARAHVHHVWIRRSDRQAAN